MRITLAFPLIILFLVLGCKKDIPKPELGNEGDTQFGYEKDSETGNDSTVEYGDKRNNFFKIGIRGFGIKFGKGKRDLQIIIQSFLGNEKRNYYGENPPSKLDVIWKTFIGGGKSNMPTKNGGTNIHYGAGWTGQPLLIKEKEKLFLFQGSYDHNVRKIDAETGEVIWKFDCGDAVKGTGSLWLNTKAKNENEKLILIQGSRQGVNVSLRSKDIFSLKGISGFSGEELYRINIENTPSVSRDVDGSALIYNDTAYIGLENGVFLIFNPNPENASEINNHFEPEEIHKVKLYSQSDLAKHGGQIITESSPCRIGRMIYVAAGSGWVFGYDMDKKDITWQYYIGSDLNGSCVVTDDSCLLVPVEKQLIPGNGGMLKLDPSKAPEEATVWYFPTGNTSLNSWSGGIIGSPAVNNNYKSSNQKHLAAFSGIDGYVYVIDYKSIEENITVKGFDAKSNFQKPKLIFKYKIGSSICTPILFSNKLIAAGYGGIYLFEFNENYEFTLLDKFINTFEATPVVYNGRVFISAKDGYLYCLGEKKD